VTSVGYATLDVIPSFKGLQSELEKGSTGPLRAAGIKGGTQFGDAAGKSAGSRFGAIFKKAATAGLIGLAGAGAAAVKLGMDSISAASDLEESTNKVSQVFGDAADSVFRFTDGTADALGQTNTQAREAAATFGIFGSAAGLADRKNAKFAKRMTTLASDLASFHNTDPSQAVEALGAALRGESEPIRAFGVMLDEATLKAEAMRLGLLKPVKDESKIKAYQVGIMERQKAYNEAVAENGKDSLEALKAEANLGVAREQLRKATEGTIGPLTNQQKLLAAQSEIFKQTEVAQGDFARTSDGLANQQRRLAARFDDAKARLGKGLLPIMTDAADFLLEKGIPAFERFSDWFTETGMPALKKFGGRVKDVSGFVQDLVGYVKELPDPAKYAGLAALVGGGAALKLRGGGGGALGSTGRALGIAKPIPVFVTNKGALGGGVAAVPDGDGKAKGGRRGAGALGLVGAVFSPQLIKEIQDEIMFPIRELKRVEQADRERNPLTFETQEGAVAFLDAAQKKADGFGETLDLIGNKKVEPLFAVPGLAKGREGLAEFIRLQIDAGKPVAPYINTTSIERAIQQARTLNAELARNASPERGMDNGVGYMSGGGTNSRGGIVIENLNANGANLDDIMRDGQRKLQRRGHGGFGR
jgi:hypothetical protein